MHWEISDCPCIAKAPIWDISKLQEKNLARLNNSGVVAFLYFETGLAV